MPKIKIYYEKNPQYRTIYVDGLIGGPTATGCLNLNFFSTRNSIPKSVEHELNIDGSISNEGKISDDSKEGIIREIEFGVYLNEKTAQEVYDLLGKFLKKPL